MTTDSWKVFLLLAATCLAAASGPRPGNAQESPGILIEQPPLKHERPLDLANQIQLEPLAMLDAARIAARSEVDAIATWNAAGQQPVKTGFFRSLPVPAKVFLDSNEFLKNSETDASSNLERSSTIAFKESPETFHFAAKIVVADAWRLQVKLSDVRLPTGTRLWVYGELEDFMSFGSELIRPDGDLWTPSIAGDTLHLELEVPKSSLAAEEVLAFRIDQIAEIFELDEQGSPSVDAVPFKFCTESAACWGIGEDLTDLMKAATAHLRTVKSGGVFVCSGTLMNAGGSFIPYLLTAEHCISNQNEAASTTFYFDYIPNSCNGLDPNLSSLPRVSGASLLATRPASDSSFLQLSSTPSGTRGFAGWTTTTPSTGQRLHSFSHPNGRSMRYSRTRVVIDGPTCSSRPTLDYLYSDQEVGGVQGGSSGSHVFTDDYRVVGQLTGACGTDPSNGCFWGSNDRFDGRFSRFYPQIRQWLSPSTSSECTEDSTTLCLNDNRFEVRASYVTNNGQSGDGRVVELTSDTGYFWFFGESNVEVVVKVLDACGLNGQFWVFAGGLTDQGVQLTVRDTVTGRIWNGGNALGQAFRTITDTSALSCS